MSDPTDHDHQRSASEPSGGPESEVYRLHAGGAPGLLGESLAELRRERPRLLLVAAGVTALVGISLVVLVVAGARR